MNEDTAELLRRLERATSSSPVDRGELDQETAEMRESWLHLGRLLKGAETAEWSAVSLRTSDRGWAASKKPHAKMWVWWSAGVASVLAVASLWWLAAGVMSSPEGADDSPVAQNPAIGIPDHRDPGTDSRRLTQTENRQPRVPTPADDANWSSALAWEDGWDDGLNRTTQVVQQFHTRSPADAPWQLLESEFEELAREFESSSL